MSEKIKTQKNKEFRIQAKSLLLTYSQIGDSIMKEDFLNVLIKEKKLDLKTYVISYENHNDEEGKHCHILFTLENKPNIRNKTFFDFKKGDHLYHANILRTSFDNRIFYVTKEDKNPLTNLKDIFLYKKGVFKKQDYKMVLTYLVDIMEKEGLEAALDFFEQNATSQMLGLFTGKIIKALKELERFKLRKNLVKSNYLYSNYNKVSEIENYIKEYQSGKLIRHALYVGGVPRIGKTEYILAALEHYGINYTYTKDVEELKTKKIQDILILDDINLTVNISREEFLQFFETVQPHTLPSRFNNPSIPEKTPKIIIQNKKLENLLLEKGLSNDKAFVGRILNLFLTEPLFIENLNVNIVNINMNTIENKPK